VKVGIALATRPRVGEEFDRGGLGCKVHLALPRLMDSTILTHDRYRDYSRPNASAASKQATLQLKS